MAYARRSAQLNVSLVTQTQPPAMPPLAAHPFPAPLLPYLPTTPPSLEKPFLTLTYATSLDSRLSLSPGSPTALSGLASKSTTHHLRSFHAAILVGVGTANADDPGLNCRHEGVGLERQPRPVIVDPTFRWGVTAASRAIETARKGEGLAPFVIVKEEPEQGDERRGVLEAVGGKLVVLGGTDRRWSWQLLLETLKELGLDSVMVEGGGAVIHDLLAEENLRLIDSVIITIAPVYLGQGGVGAAPAACIGQDGQTVPAVRFKDVKWCILERDVIMAARPIA